MKIDIKIQCRSCKGTGLYVGFAERNGAAVVCRKCDGTGCEHFAMDYIEFNGRVIRTDVVRVFGTNTGYGLSGSSAGGCTYQEWLNGGEPKPDKTSYCPYQFYKQSPQHSDHPGNPAYKELCAKHLGSIIPSCPMHVNKAQCWGRYDKAMGK